LIRLFELTLAQMKKDRPKDEPVPEPILVWLQTCAPFFQVLPCNIISPPSKMTDDGQEFQTGK
jgi:hypothetical protein